MQPVNSLCCTPLGIDLNVRCSPLRQALLTSLPVLHQCGLQPGDLRENIVVDFAKRIRSALNAPGRTEGVRKIAERFGVNPGTVQRISRPFEDASIAVA